MSNNFADSLHKSFEHDDVYHVKALRHNKMGRTIVNDLLRKMPRSLAELFTVTSFSTYGAQFGPSAIYLRVQPKGDLRDKRRNRVALGTIDKVAAVLTGHGWRINNPPKPQAKEATTRMDIILEGTKDIPLPTGQQLPLKQLRRPEIVPQKVRFNITFENFPENDRCRLVEREVTIPAQPERVLMQLVVVCDKEADGG